MKVGLLVCDHIIPEQNGYLGLFSKLLPDLEIVDFNVCDNQFPSSLTVCDSWVISGSKYSVYDDIDWINRLKSFVKEIGNTDQPCVGVCFGHQMIGEAMGGKVLKAETGWNVGVHEFEFIQHENWMHPFQEKANLLMSCQDQVVVLPPNSKVLAKTSSCPVGMIKVGERMLGIQGHPEFSKDYVKSQIEDRENRIGNEIAQNGIKSLEMELDNNIISNWIKKFLLNY